MIADIRIQIGDAITIRHADGWCTITARDFRVTEGETMLVMKVANSNGIGEKLEVQCGTIRDKKRKEKKKK